MPYPLLTLFLATLATLASFGVGLAVGWGLKGRQTGQILGDLHDRAQHHVEDAFAERNRALDGVDEMTKDMRELATQYRELHDDHEHLLAKHKNTLLQLGGVEDELRVQQESARLARTESGTTRRRIGHLEGELRALQVTAAKAVNRE